MNNLDTNHLSIEKPRSAGNHVSSGQIGMDFFAGAAVGTIISLMNESKERAKNTPETIVETDVISTFDEIVGKVKQAMIETRDKLEQTGGMYDKAPSIDGMTASEYLQKIKDSLTPEQYQKIDELAHKFSALLETIQEQLIIEHDKEELHVSQAVHHEGVLHIPRHRADVDAN